MSATKLCAVVALLLAGISASAKAAVQLYGDENGLNNGTYPVSPTVGATEIGLAPNTTTAATYAFGHPYPFSPDAGDFPGTDQIYVGSNQTAFHDGYSVQPERIAGPDVLVMDYSDLVPAGRYITSFTLGIALDDFQDPVWGDPFTFDINGVDDTFISGFVNTLNQTGPFVRFHTFGLSTGQLLPSDSLTLSIDEGGDGGDGYAIDFLTVGVTTAPLPSTFWMGLLGMAAMAGLMLVRRGKYAVA